MCVIYRMKLSFSHSIELVAVKQEHVVIATVNDQQLPSMM